MRTISSSLKEKLEKKIQTIATNSNPQMDIVAYRANRYLVQGDFLLPRTIQTGNVLGPIDVCISRPNANKDPDKIHICYAEDNLLKTASMNYQFSTHENFKYDRTIPTPSGCEGLTINDIACDFDGTWEYIYTKMMYDLSKTRWALQTYLNMTIAVVYGDKLIIHEKDNSITTLCESGVLTCSLLKGWKSVSDVLGDQGLICAYVKTDGKAYYRAYCQQSDGTYFWELEREISSVSNVKNVSIFRTNDYRICFIIETGDSENNIIIKVSRRSWSGMASDVDNINCKFTNLFIGMNVKYIKYPVYIADNENINATISNCHILADALPIDFNTAILVPTATRIDLNKVKLEFPYEIIDINIYNTMFKLDNNLSIINIVIEDGNKAIILTFNREVSKFVNLKITYTTRDIVLRSDSWTAHVRNFEITAKGTPPEVSENINVSIDNKKVNYIAKDVSRPSESITDSAYAYIESYNINYKITNIEDIPV